MSETRIEMVDTAGFWGQIVIAWQEDGRWYLDVDDRRGRGRCYLTDEQFDRLALANPRVRDLVAACQMLNQPAENGDVLLAILAAIESAANAIGGATNEVTT